mmetsp:Transcript_33955/g.97815  ORF Transcript_33955/g.97815 Transcript_33955/m.97815 type:complete len:333 (+) Transcript_33955:87-1085(+)
MGKKEGAAAPKAEGKAATKAAAKPKPQAQEPAKGEKKQKRKTPNSDVPPGALQALRPKRRPIFFLLWLLGCAWILISYSPCDVQGKKRDCGYSGISGTTCQLTGCFVKTPGAYSKKTIKVKREQGSKLGLDLDEAAGGLFLTRSIRDGAVKKYNSELPADDQDNAVLPGDRLVRVDSAKGKGIMKAMQESSAKTVVLEVYRSRLPSLLQFLHSNSPDKPNILEKVLSAPGSKYFASTWASMAQVAVPLWLISGYPLASLPSYFFVSSLVSFQLSRCCHDDTAKGNVPHCFVGRREPIATIVQKAAAETAALGQRVQGDMRGYFNWLFLPDTR